ncbi:undecaprenyl-phosphate glucose phosphotransferase [Rhodoferax sp. GW822-FHT02A01]|uniref:undecaprenyl-phosphate glucose phosphotransferase n=1 Tax=Rhodoferax sp. GW822-FHT02A01 TaxID=3141537 RepID=UPI00315CD5A0
MSTYPHASPSASALGKATAPAWPGRNNMLSLLESMQCSAALILSLWATSYLLEGEVPTQLFLLSILTFALTFPGRPILHSSYWGLLADVLLNWLWIAGLLALAGYGSGYLHEFSRKVLWTWLWVAPLSDLGLALLLRASAPTILRLQGPSQRAVIVGMNEQGLSLAGKLKASPYSGIELVGFVDSRSISRQGATEEQQLLGKLDELANLVQTKRIQIIYLSLPMASQPRILALLDSLKDTTASIYFVPDMFVTDLVQGHPASVAGQPVISVCETPFRDGNGFIKRTSDILFSLVILILVSPVLLAIAVAIKVTSPGPIIFKQRRYGLDGQEILVYKFRSMSVTEDGNTIVQAKQNDKRITPLGAILRRTSLDELPQFLNVLQGHMSIVGPRPHAVAHNELYRKLIKGYMVRHKVKPGITGWAQVNGFRGETDTLEKMQGRINYDLDYLRNWSLRLDIHIILKTVRLVVQDKQAY